MAMTTRLNLGQAQTMTVTPQLLQSIRLLQFTHLELAKFIDEQIEQNPLLEAGEPAAEPTDQRNQSQIDSDAEPSVQMNDISSAAMSDTFDTPMDNVFPDDNADSQSRLQTGASRDQGLPYGMSEAMGEGGGDIEEYIAGHVSLRDHVLEQVSFIVVTAPERLIASEIIDALDERGYVDIDERAIASRLGAAPQAVLSVLEKLQQCEPAGLFARNLAQCLKLQCARLDRLDPAMEALLDNLELLARRDFKSLRQLCGVDEADLLDMLAEIKRLDPHPGRAFEIQSVQTIIHDVSVSEAPDGTWRIELNPDALPRVLFNRDYYASLTRSLTAPAEKTFVADCFANAGWLERSLEQRAQTILKVATEIVKQQDAFLVEGVRALKPMTMRMVADAIQMHESTVSRVASNKYMMTPRGLFELRFFFTVALAATAQSDSDQAHSSQAVRQRIRDMIAAEHPAAILSDDTIVDQLNSDGIEIARRTVAKYREAMGIASSVRRRREKRARLAAAQ